MHKIIARCSKIHLLCEHFFYVLHFTFIFHFIAGVVYHYLLWEVNEFHSIYVRQQSKHLNSYLDVLNRNIRKKKIKNVIATPFIFNSFSLSFFLLSVFSAKSFVYPKFPNLPEKRRTTG